MPEVSISRSEAGHAAPCKAQVQKSAHTSRLWAQPKYTNFVGTNSQIEVALNIERLEKSELINCLDIINILV